MKSISFYSPYCSIGEGRLPLWKNEGIAPLRELLYLYSVAMQLEINTVCNEPVPVARIRIDFGEVFSIPGW